MKPHDTTISRIGTHVLGQLSRINPGGLVSIGVPTTAPEHCSRIGQQMLVVALSGPVDRMHAQKTNSG